MFKNKFLKQRNLPNSSSAWSYAKTIIPGGGQLLSKKAERFLPDQWPSYYQKAKGYHVWDLDNIKYADFAQMGVGSCIHGYANPIINKKVIKSIRNGSMSSLNSYEEIELAERLLDLHPYSSMARFARTGGEACSIAVRIARAASGKDGVAFCGYHGWHDWYISANIQDSENLNNQLLSGLNPDGVPKELAGTTFPFLYNDFDSLDIIEKNKTNIGVVIMEPIRGVPPLPGFLEKIREICDKIGAVFIIDEVTSGFRTNAGGWHLLAGVNPDMSIFGKALGNGFPISAVIGTKEVMENATKSFISSTMWTERVGFTAAVANIDMFLKEKSHEKLIFNGKMIKSAWKNSAEKTGINVSISGLDPLASLKFIDGNENVYQTYYAQEMMKVKFLVGSSAYSCANYSSSILKKFENNTSEVFDKMKKIIDKGEKIENHINGGIIKTSFKRLNG